MSSDVVLALEPVVAAFESLGVAYRVGGSVASSALGVPRSTLDVDVVCELARGQVAAFVAQLAGAFYIDADMINDAIARRASFNVVHLSTMTKVDVFVRKNGAFDRECFGRSTRLPLEEGTREFDLTTAEDIVLRKLEWYALGGGISERQWLDVLGVLRVQKDALDHAYLRKWAKEINVLTLLERAFTEAAAP